MPKVNVYLPDALAEAVRDANIPVSAICQAALERAVRDVTSARGIDATWPDESRRPGLLGRFTPRARATLTRAEAFAREVPHNYVGTEHVLVGLIDEGGNLAVKAIQSLDVELADLRAEVVASMGDPTEPVDGHLPFTPLAKRVLERTATEALGFGHNYIGCEHILLGLLATEDGLASQVLRRMGLEFKTTKRAVVAMLTGFVHARQDVPSLSDIVSRLDAIEERLRPAAP